MPKATKTRKVLIAEDERPIARALELKLTSAGFSPVVVQNGEEALAKVQEEKFGLILLDLMMPKVDGFAFLETMKKRGDKTPVVVLTNLSQPEDEKRVRDLGAKGFYVKSNTPIANIVTMAEEFLPV